MNINPIAYNDLKALSSLQPEGWLDIVPHFDFYVTSNFCFPIKVTIDKEIVGIGATIIHGNVAWLAHIIVHPDHRRKGLGQLITRTLIDIAKNNHCSTVYLIATELGEPVYAKEGFVSETEYLVYKKVTKKDWAISKNIQPYREEYEQHLVAFDKAVSGEDRMMHLKEYLADGFVYRNGDNIDGYYLPTLGEGFVAATGEQAGIELLKLRLKDHDNAVIPEENHAARKFLSEIGFGEIKTTKRMRLGDKRPVEFTNIYNRIGGNIG